MADEKSTPSTPAFEADTEQAPIDLSPAYGDTGAVVRPTPAPNIPTMSAAPAPSPIDRVWSAIKEGIPAFNDKFEAASHTDTGKLASGETPKMQLVTPEAAMTESEKKAHPIVTGIAETAGGLTSPENVAIMAGTAGFGELPGAAKLVIPKLVSLGFSAQSLKGAYDQIPEFKKAMDAGDASEAERILTHIVLDTAVGVYAGQHATEGVGEHVKETAKNAVAGAKEELGTMENATAPEGSLEAGFAKLGGKKVGVDLRGPDTFGRTGGKFGQAVDTAHQVMREHGITGPEKIEPEIQAEGPEWDRVHSAIVDGKKVGSVGYHMDPEGVAQIYGSQVSPELRGKGIGQKLYVAAIDDARKAGASRITSDSTNTTEDANRVWEKLRDKGHPVEPITHANGKPGYQVDFEKPAEAPVPTDFSAVNGKKLAEPPAPQVSPNETLQESAQKYAKTKGMPKINHEPVEQDPARAVEIANAYEAAKHEPDNPKVKEAYDALKSETKDQFHHLRDDLGLKFEPTAEDPYTSAGEMMADIKDNNRLKVLTGSAPGADHPLSEIDPETHESYNTLFRWVHDAMGHAAGGNDFSENGEKSATEAHAQMYSPKAAQAMRTETEGQTSHFFHNPKIQAGEAEPGEFAPQKAAILPDKTEPTEHPTVAALKTKYGSSADPGDMVKGGASFLHDDGTVTNIGSLDHPAAISSAMGKGIKGGADVDRVGFINDTGSIRVRHRPSGRSGPEIVFSVPEKGVTTEQVDMMKQAVGKMGRNSNLLIEAAHEGNEVSDTPRSWPENPVKEFARPSDVDAMLEHLGIALEAENNWHTDAGARAAKEESGGIDPRTGKSDTAGVGVEIMPELRQPLDHAPTADDFKKFYEQHKEVFDKNPELRVGWDNKSAADGGHEINVGAVGDEAARVAKKLDQKSAFDIAKGENIPTKGSGLRTEFPNYPIEDRVKDLKGEPLSTTKGFEHLSPEVYDHLEPDERAYLHGNKLLQRNTMAQYHKIAPSVLETTNAMQAGAALGGWWRRYIDVFQHLAGADEEAQASTIGPSHAEILKQWHAAVSGNKSVEDANNLAWHSYADWLDAGKPTDRTSIDNIVKKNAAQPEGSEKRGNAAISDTLNKKGKIVSKGIDTNKLFGLVNSPEMRGERPFSGDVFHDDPKNPLMGPTEGARKIPSMGATVAGIGNLNRLVIDAHIRDFYGRTSTGGPAAQYIADSAHLRQAAEDLGLKGGEGQEQLWGTVLGLKQLLKQGLTPEEASGKLNSDVINQIGKDYAEVIANDPEISKPGGVLDRLKKTYGIGRGADAVGAANRQTPSASASEGQPAGSQAPVDTTQLAKTAERIRGTISESKIKKTSVEWQPPAGIEDGIPSTTPVSTKIPLQKISVSPQSYSRASSDIAQGKGSKTKEPIRIFYNPDNGQYLVEDGMHRLVEAHQKGDTSVSAKIWSGYSDSIANVHGEKMDLSPDDDTSFNFGANAQPKPTPKPTGKSKKFTALDLIRGLSGLSKPGRK